MGICRNCNSETTRIRTTYHSNKLAEKIVAETDECPNCSPGTFEPRWRQERGVAAWEAYPTKYKKKYMPDGRVGYFATDEWRADTEAKIAAVRSDGKERYREALEQKRVKRRTNPLSEAEVERALNKWRTRLEAAAKNKREYEGV